eukprot:5305116-Pleurochrysis_carterae.AAC.2
MRCGNIDTDRDCKDVRPCAPFLKLVNIKLLYYADKLEDQLAAAQLRTDEMSSAQASIPYFGLTAVPLALASSAP